MIDSLDHIQLAMPPGQEEAARVFFRDTLGMSENEKPEALASRGGCWFRTGSAIVHLGVEEDFIPQKKLTLRFASRTLIGLRTLWKGRDLLSHGMRRRQGGDGFTLQILSGIESSLSSAGRTSESSERMD